MWVAQETNAARSPGIPLALVLCQEEAMPQNPKSSGRHPRESDRPASPPATRSSGRLVPDDDKPTGVAEPEDEFLDEDEEFDDFDEPDDAPVR